MHNLPLDLCGLRGQHDHLSDILWGKVKKKERHATCRPGGEGDKAVYQCSAHRGYLHKPRGTWKLASCACTEALTVSFGLRQIVIWCASNTLQYNLTCQMVQSTNNPLWPMALAHAVSKVVNEKILCAAEKNAWILLSVCRIFFGLQLNIHNNTSVILQMLTSSVKLHYPSYH